MGIRSSQYAYQLYYIKGAEAANKGKAKVADVGIKAKDDKTLVVELENPTPFFTELTAFYTYMPVNKKVAEKNKNWFTNAGENYVSNGPFVLSQWKHGGSITLEKNNEYWDKDTVKLKKINMSMIKDTNTELSMFKKGELDWAGSPTGSLPTESLKTLKKEGGLKIQTIAGIYNYKFNTEVKPLNNANIRKALAYSINRQAIVDKITQGEQVPAMAIVPPTMEGFTDNKTGYFKDHDVDTAKKLLEKGAKELGYKSVSDLPALKLSYNTDEGHQKIAQAIQEMWKKDLGVKVELDNSEWNVYIDKIHSGDYQIGRMGWLGDFNDPVNFLELYKDKDGGNNDTGWESKEYKQLLNDSAKETDKTKREEMLKKAEEIIINDMPIAPIYFYTQLWVQDPKLKGVVVSGLGDVQYKWAHFEK